MDCSNYIWAKRLNSDTREDKLLHHLDGRSRGLNQNELLRRAEELASFLEKIEFDYIIGFAEGGLIPAFAISMVTGKDFLGSYRIKLDLPREVHFQEPHSARASHFLYGLQEGDSVVLVEDEITTGNTIINAITALSEVGISVKAVLAYYFCGDDQILNKIGHYVEIFQYLKKIPPARVTT